MKNKDGLEAHLWELLDKLSGRRFRKFAEIDMATWKRLRRYRAGELQIRPLNQDKLLEMRTTLLDNLDAWERVQGRRPIV